MAIIILAGRICMLPYLRLQRGSSAAFVRMDFAHSFTDLAIRQLNVQVHHKREGLISPLVSKNGMTNLSTRQKVWKVCQGYIRD